MNMNDEWWESKLVEANARIANLERALADAKAESEPLTEQSTCDVPGCHRILKHGESFICGAHPRGYQRCYYCNTPFDASGPDYPKGIVLTDWCCPTCDWKRKVENLKKELAEREANHDRLMLRVRALLSWVPKDDSNRKWIEELDQ